MMENIKWLKYQQALTIQKGKIIYGELYCLFKLKI